MMVNTALNQQFSKFARQTMKLSKYDFNMHKLAPTNPQCNTSQTCKGSRVSGESVLDEAGPSSGMHFRLMKNFNETIKDRSIWEGSNLCH